MKKILLFALFVASTFTANAQATYNFTNTWEGAYFSTAFVAGQLQGTLTSITLNSTLTASTGDTYANDLTVLVATGLGANDVISLQAGGYSDFEATESLEWSNGTSSVAGTVCSGTLTLATPINFTTGTTLKVYVGNGYYGTANTGSWTGTLTLNGVTNSLGVVKNTVSEFSVYPNPANDVVTISNAANATIDAVTVSDLNGRTVKSVKLNGETTAQVNIADLSAGVYMMNISSDQGTSTKKIVKK